MPNYAKGTMGKLIVQDWNVVSNWSDAPLLFILTRQQAAALISLAETLAWRTRWQNMPGQDIIDAFASETIFNLMNPVTCAMLHECLQPLFDALETKIDSIQTDVDIIEADVEAIQENTTNNASNAPDAIPGETDPKICGAAAAVVDAMDIENKRVYAEAEGGIFDNLMEAYAAILALVPKLAGMPASALAALTQSYFESQVTEYELDFAAARSEMVKRLYCAVILNDGQFTYDVWGDWLDALDAAIPGNRAARIFAAYAPARQTFINQIAQFINQDISLQTFFENLSGAFETGKLDPQGLCAGENCGGTCALRYNAFEEHGFELSAGNDATIDSAGWYLSGAFTGFTNPQWVIGEDMTIDGSYTAIRIDTLGLQKNPVEYNTLIWYYDEFAVQHSFDVDSPEMNVIEDGANVTFIVDLMTPVAMTGWGFNTNQPVNPEFRVTGAQLCE